MGRFRTVKTSLYRLTRLVLYGSTNNTNARQIPVASNNVLIAAMYGFLLDDCDLRLKKKKKTILIIITINHTPNVVISSWI